MDTSCVLSETNVSVEDLIKQFEGDIVYDAHSYTARFERSRAQKELVRRGKEVLPPIITHLRAHPPGEGMDLKTAWGHLLNWIEINIDPKKSGPQTLKDTTGWIAWAERMLN
jgi:hypothetical protein